MVSHRNCLINSDSRHRPCINNFQFMLYNSDSLDANGSTMQYYFFKKRKNGSTMYYYFFSARNMSRSTTSPSQMYRSCPIQVVSMASITRSPSGWLSKETISERGGMSGYTTKIIGKQQQQWKGHAEEIIAKPQDCSFLLCLPLPLLPLHLTASSNLCLAW